ncbi:MAG: DUF359 domain-containing protein [Nitrososphaerales archaeon]
MSKELLSAKLQSGRGLLVSVGDKTTDCLIRYHLNPDVQIIDGVEQRIPREKPKFEGSSDRIFHARNSAGVITKETLGALSSVLESLESNPNQPVRLEIEGEEDLLVLPVVAFFPEGTTVAYGQPGEGMVIVQAMGNSRDFARSALSEIGVRKLL